MISNKLIYNNICDPDSPFDDPLRDMFIALNYHFVPDHSFKIVLMTRRLNAKWFSMSLYKTADRTMCTHRSSCCYAIALLLFVCVLCCFSY